MKEISAATLSRRWVATLIFGALGVVVPLLLLVVSRQRCGTWWPDWTIYLWQTSYMFIATSAIVNWFWYEVAAISIALNALLYAMVGALLAVAGEKLDRMFL